MAKEVLQNFYEKKFLKIEKIKKKIKKFKNILKEKKLDLFSSTVNNK